MDSIYVHQVLTPKEIAKLLNIGYSKTLNLIKYGNLPYIRIGKTYRISRRVFEAWLSEDTTKILLSPEK